MAKNDGTPPSQHTIMGWQKWQCNGVTEMAEMITSQHEITMRKVWKITL